MKIAVVCANGKAGKLIVGEALNRNMEVTAVVRNENKTAAPQAIVKDLFELSAEDLSGFDAVAMPLALGLLKPYPSTAPH